MAEPAVPAPRLIATMLAGNNAAIIAEAAASVLPWADALLLVDTGITDGSDACVREIAGEKLSIVSFPWQNDFAAARNFCLHAATERGATWALTIDTDERLSFPGYTSREDLLRTLAGHPSVCTWLVHEEACGYAKERFVRLPTHLVWQGRTHEALLGATAEQRCVLPGSSFTEVSKTAEQCRAKLYRDLPILQQDTRERPQDARGWYYLGQTLHGLERYPEAIAAYQKCAFLDGWDEEAAWACYQAATCLHRTGHYRKALEMCGFGLARHAGFPELAWLAGHSAFQMKEYSKAIWWSELAIRLGSAEGLQAAESRVSFRHLHTWYEAPFDVLRFAHRQLGQIPRSQQALEKHRTALELRKLRTATPGATSAQSSPPALQATPTPTPTGEFRKDWFSHNIGNWGQWLAEYKDRADCRFLEIGAFEGMASCWLLDNILTHPSSELVCCDLWSGIIQGDGNTGEQVEAAFDNNVRRFGRRIRKLKGRSDASLARFLAEGRQFDFIYVDGDHYGPEVLRDGVLAFSLLSPGGILVFDDYGWQMPGVKVLPNEAIEAFLQVFRYEIEVLAKQWQVALRRIPK
jgi:tetratricopeptide (TPR) repeat protein